MRAVVIGGGIIGLCSAYYLRKKGWEVTLVDRSDLSDNCSYGNLGMIVPSHFVPLAAPGIISQGIRWMLNNKSPFYIRPSLNKELLSWGINFIKNATERHVENAAPSLLHLNLFSKKLYEELSVTPGFDFSLEQKGILMYYKTQKAREHEIHLCVKATQLGLDVKELSPGDVQELEPELELDIIGAMHYRCDAHLYPNHLMQQLINYLKDAGVSIEFNTSVESFVKYNHTIKKVICPAMEIEADLFIIAAGSWLPGLAKLAGVRLQLMPGKGYSFTIDKPRQMFNLPAILCEARVAITPMNGKMRYGGTMEIGKVNSTINLNRVKGILEAVPRYFPNCRIEMPEAKDIWFGFRPCTPDGLPYIGFAKNVDNLIIAGGHAMSGLSLGPATGKVVSELAGNEKLSVNIDAFDPARFS